MYTGDFHAIQKKSRKNTLILLKISFIHFLSFMCDCKFVFQLRH